MPVDELLVDHSRLSSSECLPTTGRVEGNLEDKSMTLALWYSLDRPIRAHEDASFPAVGSAILVLSTRTLLHPSRPCWELVAF